MASELSSLAQVSSKSEADVINGELPSDELDHVPLIRRRSMLLANKLADSTSERGTGKPLMSAHSSQVQICRSTILVKEEDEGCDALVNYPYSVSFFSLLKKNVGILC